ncbi:hypothetical protein [Paeniglutamicibacter cryotolerans]|uniref:Uncharacterized protein n=1 Tax=Paeniglutamicibacter cryotolerans TaxID=670079 RepID=A0A839R053_9MICC|nr:hypothetical protein [Paeniglutamicibacter cryotolerans]MBB2997621.1 hypothetical protein [Paeniglutamicibacter cryotolerans]
MRNIATILLEGRSNHHLAEATGKMRNYPALVLRLVGIRLA